MNVSRENITIPDQALRPSVMDVYLNALKDNAQTIQRHVGSAKVMAVVKANAYGHGLVPVAKYFEECKVNYLGVAFVEEGIELRNAGVTLPILVLGGISGGQVELFLRYDLEITASSISKLQAIEETAKRLGKRAKVHLKIDTGLERIGVHYYNAEGFFEAALQAKHCDFIGVFSHFVNSGEDDALTSLQLERFLEAIEFFNKRSLPMPLRHIANSSGVLSSSKYHLDMVRPGIILYGVPSAPRFKDVLSLQRAMTLRTQVVYFKVAKKGAGVGYNHTWRAPEDTRIVTLAHGYGDGYFRAFSNKSSVLIRGKRYPVVGNICMDQMMVDIGPRGEAYNGDDVVLLGGQGSEEITVKELADLIGTNSHEMLTAINVRVPRRYIREASDRQL